MKKSEIKIGKTGEMVKVKVGVYILKNNFPQKEKDGIN